MEIFVARNGEQFGPYTREMALLYLRENSLSTDDLCWHEGLPDWKNLGEVIGIRPPGTHKPLAPVRAGAAAKSGSTTIASRAGKGWANSVMNLIIVGLAVGVGIYFLRSPQRQQLVSTWLPRMVALIHPAPATQNAPAPAAVVNESAPSEPQATPVIEEPKQPVAAGTTITVPAAPTPDVPGSVDWRALSASPGEWPKTVILKDAVSFPAIFGGRVVGSIKVPRGTAVKLNSIKGEQLTVEYQGVSQVVLPKDTDLEERLPVTARVQSTVDSLIPPASAQSDVVRFSPPATR